MYRLSIKNNCYTIKCHIEAASIKILKFTVDTGAAVTCLKAAYIDSSLTEDSMRGVDTIRARGIASNHKILYYRYHLRNISFAGLNLGSRDVWVTFDPYATDCLLGMDILSDCNILICGDDHSMYFFS